MKIIKFNEAFSDGKELKYEAYDIDDNITINPTRIHMEHLINGQWVPEDVSTQKFAEVRNDKENWRISENAFCEFRDNGPRGKNAFIEDFVTAIKTESFGPSWNAFIKCLEEGNLFAIITARGHEPETIRKGIEWVINNYLNDTQQFLIYSNCLKHAYIFSDKNIDSYDRIPKGILTETPLIKLYLDNCYYFGVSSNWFAKEFGSANASNPEKGKQEALNFFINKCNEYAEKINAKSVSISFSDDDKKNIAHIEKFFHEKISDLINLDRETILRSYDTSDRSIPGGNQNKITINPIDEKNSRSIDLGTSVIPFTKWNNMTQQLYNKDSKDDYHNRFKNNMNQLLDLNKKDGKKKN
jgi:hypothetical protein